MVDQWLVETDLDEEWDLYTRANVGEVFPDPVAPLTSSGSRTRKASVPPSVASATHTTGTGVFRPRSSRPTRRRSSV